MPYIIDGHNLIPKIPGLRLDDPDDEQKLISLLQDFCRLSGKQVDVYFDLASPGGAGRRSLGRVAVFFVRAGSTADEAIRVRLSKMGRSARNYTVVSSDQGVQTSARHSGARSMESGQFSALLQSTLAKAGSKDRSEASLTATEIEEWLKFFQEKKEPRSRRDNS
jgi:predicted RNA-binding protein with PIN domain